MKVALVYDRVNKWGGAERVLLSLHDLFPNADLFTSVYNKEKANWAKVFPNIKTTYLQTLKFLRARHEMIPFLMPIFFETFDFSEYDLVISLTSESAKGIITKPGTLHICYCLTPTRYLWSGYESYFNNPWLKKISSPVVKYLQKWDIYAKDRPDFFTTISHTVKNRVNKYYNISSKVIYPPVRTDLFKTNEDYPKKYYLVVSRLVPYKRVEIAVIACTKLNLPLVVVGSGSEYTNLKKIAGKSVRFVTKTTDKLLARLYIGAYALIFPGEEDFGLVMVEAQLSGIPVIAYRVGGASEIVQKNTGVLINSQTVDGFCRVLERFDYRKYDRRTIIKNGLRFSENRFKKEFKEFIKKCHLKKI